MNILEMKKGSDRLIKDFFNNLAVEICSLEWKLNKLFVKIKPLCFMILFVENIFILKAHSQV